MYFVILFVIVIEYIQGTHANHIFNLDIFFTNMSEIKIENVEKNTDSILELLGKEPFVDWDTFSLSSTDVAKSIDGLNTALAIFREVQHKSFIQTMRKLKSLDIPDLLQAVKSKKLPKEALRGVLGRFKLEGEKLELLDTKEQLQENAKKEFEVYVEKNRQFAKALNSYAEFINQKAAESGLLPSQEVIPTTEKRKSSVQFNVNEEQANNIASSIKIKYLAGTQLLSFETYKDIVDGTFKLIQGEYQKLSNEARKKQRANIKDHKEYLNNLNDFLMNGEALINEGQLKLAKKVGVTEDQLAQSEEALMQRGMAESMLMIQSQLRAKVKESLRSEKDVSVEIAKEIVEYQVKLIDERAKDINSILSNLEKGPEVIQMVPMILALILNDYVFEKYGYEEEDFMKNLGETVITTNPDFIRIFRAMEMGIMKLMQSLDIVPEEVKQMMKSQQDFMEQMGAQGMPSGMLPGMMPGMNPNNNPMDMLQMQQMQQMQAMFSQMGIQPPK